MASGSVGTSGPTTSSSSRTAPRPHHTSSDFAFPRRKLAPPSASSLAAVKPKPGSAAEALAQHRMKLKALTTDTLQFLDTKLMAGLNPASDEDARAIVLYKKIKADQLCQLAASMAPTGGSHFNSLPAAGSDSDGEGGADLSSYEEAVHKVLDHYEDAIEVAEEKLLPTDGKCNFMKTSPVSNYSLLPPPLTLTLPPLSIKGHASPEGISRTPRPKLVG